MIIVLLALILLAIVFPRAMRLVLTLIFFAALYFFATVADNYNARHRDATETHENGR